MIVDQYDATGHCLICGGGVDGCDVQQGARCLEEARWQLVSLFGLAVVQAIEGLRGLFQGSR